MHNLCYDCQSTFGTTFRGKNFGKNFSKQGEGVNNFKSQIKFAN